MKQKRNPSGMRVPTPSPVSDSMESSTGSVETSKRGKLKSLFGFKSLPVVQGAEVSRMSSVVDNHTEVSKTAVEAVSKVSTSNPMVEVSRTEVSKVTARDSDLEISKKHVSKLSSSDPDLNISPTKEVSKLSVSEPVYETVPWKERQMVRMKLTIYSPRDPKDDHLADEDEVTVTKIKEWTNRILRSFGDVPLCSEISEDPETAPDQHEQASGENRRLTASTEDSHDHESTSGETCRLTAPTEDSQDHEVTSGETCRGKEESYPQSQVDCSPEATQVDTKAKQEENIVPHAPSAYKQVLTATSHNMIDTPYEGINAEEPKAQSVRRRERRARRRVYDEGSGVFVFSLNGSSKEIIAALTQDVRGDLTERVQELSSSE